MFLSVDFGHVQNSQCPWSSLCYLGESQPPPSSDAISRTAAQNHTQTQQHHIYIHRHIQSHNHGGRPGAARSVSPSSLVS